MGNVPVRREQIRHHMTKFMAWLNANGAEIGQPTNPYEVIRYRAYWRNTHRAGVHIIYAKENGLLTWTGGSLGHFRAFLAGEPMDGAAKVPAIAKPADVESEAAKRRRKLLARDGADCWFCGLALGSDATIEHLVPKSKGGGNRLDNYALAHSACNQAAADKPLVEKIALRESLRAKSKETV